MTYLERKCLHELIAAQARMTPGEPALVFRDRVLTYAEMDARSNQMARHLRRLGVKAESVVGVCMDRSAELVVTLLGVMKAGGAYVPLDPTFPAQRLAYMLEDSGAAVLVAGERQLALFERYSGEIVRPERNAATIEAESISELPSDVGAENLAYVIYTSGSTGKPKGVMIEHGSLVNFLLSMKESPGMKYGESLLAVSTFSFDIAALEFYLPLTVGATVIIADKETVTDAKKLAAELEFRKPAIMQATPATWRFLIANGWAGDKNLKALNAGEALPRDLAEELLRRAGSVWNMYGPTETTVFSLVWPVRSETGPVPIGLPIANTTVYVLNEELRPAAAGETGKLYIGGKGLARGYRNRPDLTAQKFVLKFEGGERIYDTGDLARVRRDGAMEWLGRMDSQVKIRGYRIELEEIETALRRHPQVRDAVATTKTYEGEDKRLVAYAVARNEERPAVDELRRHLEKSLAPYMIPSAILFLDELPMTPNGKIDRLALPDPATEATRRQVRERTMPRTPIEAKLLRLFEELLQAGEIGTTDSFLEFGGNSLLAVQLVMRIEKETGHSIPTATLLQAPTVRQLAAKLEDRTYSDASSLIVELKTGGDRQAAPLFCIHWLDAKLVTFYQIATMLRDDRTVYGLQPGGAAERKDAPRTIKEMAMVYLREIRERRPNGPYHLAGSCLGGVVAFEIAQQLTAAGEEVGMLLMIDAAMPGPLEFLHERPWLVEFLDRYFGEFLLSPAAAVKRWTAQAITKLSRRAGGKNSMRQASEDFREVSRSAAGSYLPLPYPGKVTLLICSDAPIRTYEDRRMGWSAVAEGGFEVHVVPGNHTTMEHEPNIQVIADKFQRCFDRSADQPGGNGLEVTRTNRAARDGYRQPEQAMLESGTAGISRY